MGRECGVTTREQSLTDTPVFVVQFPHPGGEHVLGSGGRMPWNTGRHGRKFLRSAGRSVDAQGRAGNAALVFWGEWEAPSRIVRRWPWEGQLPRELHVPVWERPATLSYRQNTDPWVFGETFRYSNCKQLTYRQNPSALQALTPGSVILFGSRLYGEFVLDTVFVVKQAEPYVPHDPPDTDEAFRVCTIDSVITDGRGDYPFTLYHGATFDEPVAGMFSFVPCRDAARTDARFARPVVSLPGHINPASAQSPSGATRPQTVEQAFERWRSVCEQVFQAGCELGVSFDTPRLDG